MEKIMKKTGTMEEKRRAITDFNEQLEIVIRVKERIQSRSIAIDSSVSKRTKNLLLDLRQETRALRFRLGQRIEEAMILRLKTKV